jgi:hypothetical protein
MRRRWPSPYVSWAYISRRAAVQRAHDSVPVVQQCLAYHLVSRPVLSDCGGQPAALLWGRIADAQLPGDLAVQARDDVDGRHEA